MSDSLRTTLLRHKWLHVILWLAIAVVVNHLSSQYFLRTDLTSNQLYTLSDVSRQSVQDLDRPLQVRVYFSRDLKAPYNNHHQALMDKLEEFAAWSRGKLTIESLEPDSSSDMAKEAQSLGVQPIPYMFRKGTRREARQVFMGVALMYGERQIAVGPIVSLETMEYELVRAIRDLTGDPETRSVVGYVISDGEPDLSKPPSDNPLGMLRDKLADTHSLRPITLGGDEGVPEDIDALLIMGPQQPVPPRAQYQLDQYLLSGRPLGVFVSSMRPDFRTMRAIPIRHELNGLLGHYGVQLNKDALIDRKRNESFPVPVVTGDQMRNVSVNYPLIPNTMNIHRNHPIVNKLDRAILPFAATLSLSDELPPGLEGTVLISSADTGSSISSLRYVHPDVFKNPTPGEVAGPHDVAVALAGRFSSYFANRPVPPPIGMAPDDPRFKPDPTETILDGAPSRLVVVSSTDFVANNQPFILNAVDWMLDDNALLEIRNKLSASHMMEPPEESQRWIWRVSLVLFPLALLGLLGLLMWWLARRAK